MRQQDEAEFRDFVISRAPALRRTAYLMCGDWHAAEDAVQTTFTKAYLAWVRVSAVENVDAYVRRILMRVVIDEGRRPWRREHTVAAIPEAVAVGGSNDDRDLLMRALRAMPTQQRAVVVLRYWEDMSVDQAATTLGVTVGTIKSQSSRGLDTLRRLLADRPTLVITSAHEEDR